MEVVTTCAQVNELARKHPGPVVLVPTMGALHEGHLSLVRRGQAVPGALVIVSIFVNPLQFGAGEDLDAYPRTLDSDVAALRGLGVDAVFAPSPAEMYPAGQRTMIHPGPAGHILEARSRPTHFAGVLTVVHKLFAISRCTHAVFGEKDYQQLVLIRQMVEDLNLPVEVLGAPVVREDSGLAKSSRNQYLRAHERECAAALSRALFAGARHHSVDAIVAAAREVLDAQDGLEVDYLELRGPELGEPVAGGQNRLLVAAKVGTTRLIDNVAVTLD